jgi:hypothetical protein
VDPFPLAPAGDPCSSCTDAGRAYHYNLDHLEIRERRDDTRLPITLLSKVSGAGKTTVGGSISQSAAESVHWDSE